MWTKPFCWAAPSLRSDSDSELSPSDSGEEVDEDEEEEEEEQKVKKLHKENVKTPRTPNKGLSAALYKTPAKKSKATCEALSQPSLVEEYFEAHGSSKVLTSDRTLERLHTPKLDRVGAQQSMLWRSLTGWGLSASLFYVCRRHWSNSWKKSHHATLKRSRSSTRTTKSTSANGCCSCSESFLQDSGFWWWYIDLKLLLPGADWDLVCWCTVWAARKVCWRTSVCLTCPRKSTLSLTDFSHPSLWNRSVGKG